MNDLAAIDVDSRRFEEGRGRLRQAIEYQRKALASYPGHAEYRQKLDAHLRNLITAAQGLDDPGDVANAELELVKLHDSDPAIIALDARLASIIKGEQAPKNNPERLQLAGRAYEKALHATAARLWAEALDADPKLREDRKLQHAYNAACAAALAASGQGRDDPSPDNSAKIKFRGRAIEWLKAELDLDKKILERGNAEVRDMVVKQMIHWKKDSDLAGIRDEKELAMLPEAERSAFKQLWDDVERLRVQAGGR